MARAFIIMLDSFGIGATKDAEKYGDRGADTLRHIAEHCAAGLANQDGVRQGELKLPNLTRLGLNQAAKISQGQFIPGLATDIAPTGIYGSSEEVSHGKDTQSGHWEMAGAPVLYDWGYFTKNTETFPAELLTALITENKLTGVLGNKHASGTEIIAELGDEHQRTGKPIVYTSADSVFQIAAHETSFGLDRLYQLCESARRLVDHYHIGRVIARPFLGESGNYYRTGNRHDYAIPPHAPTLLDVLYKAGGEVIAIGKVSDIFAGSGVSQLIKATGNKDLFTAFVQAAKNAPEQSLTFVNLVDFDMQFGHRRDVIGYAKALEEFDRWLPEFETLMMPGDIAVITADHGCDPTFPGSDHTREQVPVLAFGPSIVPKSIGRRETFADIGQSLAHHLHLPSLAYGKNFL